MGDTNRRLSLLAALLLSACVTDISAHRQPDTDCCTLLPDQDAVLECAGPFPVDTCGVLACPQPDGSIDRINWCGPRSQREIVAHHPHATEARS